MLSRGSPSLRVRNRATQDGSLRAAEGPGVLVTQVRSSGVTLTPVTTRMASSTSALFTTLDDPLATTITEAWGSRVRFRASRTLRRHRRMRQKRASAGNRNQVIPAISIIFPDKWDCAMRDIFNPQTRWSRKMDTSRWWQCAPKARIISGGGIHPESCRLIR